MASKNSNPPFNPEELQKELQELLKGKFGTDAKVVFSPHLQQEEFEEETEEEPEDDITESILSFDLKPKDIKEYLDRYVIKQDEAKIVLSTVICDHYNHVKQCLRSGLQDADYAKQNVIMMGPTGIGKTYLIRNIARMIGVPFVKADATKFSETGYVGSDVDDLVRELVQRANGDVRIAEFGIVYLDEVDKISGESQLGRDVSGRGVQFGLLKLMEETEVPARSPMDIQAQIQSMMDIQSGRKPGKNTINTRHILFIVSGAFTGIEDIIRRRVGDQRVGFTTEVLADEAEDYLRMVQSVDFVEYGFEPEFIGRLPVSVVCHGLSVQDMYDILRFSEGSVIRQMEDAFKAYGIDTVFTDDALYRIAEKAHEGKTGARGLVSVLERTLRHFKFELPSSDIDKLIITPEVVENPREQLALVLDKNEVDEIELAKGLIRRFEKSFRDEHEITITFDDKALQLAAEKCKEQGTEPAKFCEELLKDYEYGLILIRKNTGQNEFVLDPDVIKDPQSALNEWIRESVENRKSRSEN